MDDSVFLFADLSNDATYGETLFDTFGRRVIGVQIGRSGDGTTSVQRGSEMDLSQSIISAGPSCSTSCSPSCETVGSCLLVARKADALMSSLWHASPSSASVAGLQMSVHAAR